MKTADQQLLERWRVRGDADAFREITTRYANLVYATARRVLRDAVAAEDVAQECFEALALRREEAPAYLGAWLHTVATNRALKHLASGQRRRAREERAAAMAPEYTRTEWDDIYEHVDAAIAELPADYRAAVVGHYLEGQGKAELARALGVSRPTIHYRIDKGLEQARLALRRRGVTASAGAFTAAMAAQASQAAPAGLIAALGKLAVAGAPFVSAAPAGGSVLRGLVLKKIVIGAACTAAIVGGFAAMVRPPNTVPSIEMDDNAVATPDSLVIASAPDRAARPIIVANSPVPLASGVDNLEDLLPGAQGWMLVKSGKSEVTGRVVDTRGKPVFRASILPRADVASAYRGVLNYRDVWTDHDGRFRIAVETGDLIQVRVTHESYLERTIAGIEVGTEEMKIVLEDRVAISGSVVDARTRAALPRFTITAKPTRNLAIAGDSISDSQDVHDSRGWFALDGVETGDSVLVVEAEGYAPAFTPLSLKTNEPVRGLLITLQPGAIVEGRVIDPEGMPVASAKVHTSKNTATGSGGSVLTDENGSFKIDTLFGEESALYATDRIVGKGSAALAWNGATHLMGVDIVLEKARMGAVEVLVTSGGKASEGTRVYAEGQGDLHALRKEMLADFEGRAILSDLEEGTWKIGAVYPDKSCYSSKIAHTVEVTGGAPATVQLELAAVFSVLEGRIRNGDAFPTGGLLQIAIADQTATFEHMVELNARGEFVFDMVPSGEGTLIVNAAFSDGSGRRTVPVTIRAGESQHVDIDFGIAGTIQGFVSGIPEFQRGLVVLSRGERAPAELEVDATSVSSGLSDNSMALIAEDGSYILEGVAPGRYTLLAHLDGPRPTGTAPIAAADVEVVDGETTVTNFRLND